MRRRFRFFPANPWGDDLSPEVSLEERTSGGGLRPQSAPAGGAVAICPHCWGLNVGGERLCGRCGADMTLLLQESGGLRRTAPCQSPVPVRVAHRLGVGTRAVLLLMTALLALAWLVMPLLGVARMHRPRAGWREGGRAGSGRPTVPAQRGFGAAAASFAPVQRQPVPPSRYHALPPSAGRGPGMATVTTNGRV